jgi:hypothetical protein
MAKSVPAKTSDDTPPVPATPETPYCGILMPISEIDGCLPSHWDEVNRILTEAIEAAAFKGRLVSDANETTFIHKTIVENLLTAPMAVCDVSGKNPNVMFELGLRLAFDLPTVIVKDDATNYSFDVGPIRHIGYPRSLRYSAIGTFKEELTATIVATHNKKANDANYSPFLKHFGTFEVPTLHTNEVSSDAYIVNRLGELQLSIERLRQDMRTTTPKSAAYITKDFRRAVSARVDQFASENVQAGNRHEIARVVLRDIGYPDADVDGSDPLIAYVLAQIDAKTGTRAAASLTTAPVRFGP